MTSKHRRFCPLTLYRDGTDIDRIIVVNDIPSGVDEDDLVEYIEDVCSCNVEDVYFSDDADHVALMKLEEPIEDLLGCKRKISRRKLDRQVISVQRVDPPNGIVVTDLPYGLTSDMLDSYFRSRASGNTSKSPVSLIMSSQIAIVKLRYPSKVLETILSRQHSPFDYSITVEPYYSPFHDEVVSRLKQESIKTYNSESSSEDSSNEGYKNESNESIDRSPTSRSSRGILNNQGSMSSRSSSAEYSDSSRQTKCFSIGPQSDESSDSSSESGKKHMCRGARQGKAKDRKRTRDCETVPLDMDYICENDEDKLLLAKIFKDAVGETFKDSMEMKYDCTIEIEFITKDEAAIRNAARQTGSRRGHRVKSGWVVASATNQLRKANHAVVDISSLKVMLSDNGFRELSNLHITSPYSFCEPRKVSSRTQAYRKNSFQFNNSTVTIKLGNITKERVDVIVNVVGLDQDYSGNRISSSIARAGGKGVTKMLEQHTGDSVMKIGSGNLPCDKIYTLTLDTYRGNKSEKIYKETIEECLNEGVTDKIRSISFPIIGYGKAFKYPKPFVLETLVSQTIQTTELPSNTSLKSFTIVTSDEDIYDDLETLLQQESSAKQKGAVAVSYQPPAQPPPTTVSRTKLVGCKIFINARKRDIDDLRDIIGNSVKEQLLYTKRITKTSSSSCMPLRTRGHTFGYAAKTKFVHVTDSDSFSITLKGHRDTIKMSTKEMVSLMDTNDPSKMCETFKCPPKFWKIIANEDPQSPPNWKNLEPNTELRVLFRKNPPKRRFYRVDVDKTTEKAVTTLVKKTWKKEHVGKGKDAVNLTHKNIRVKKVERIENLELFNKYAQKRVEYFRMLADERQQKFLSLDELKVKQQGMILTKQHLPDILKQDIFPEINEHFLFHGTKPDFIQTTIRSGLDSRLGNANGLFGSGMYTAESSTKADQYTDSKTNRTSGDHQMLLVRMLLGKMYVCSDPNPPKYRRPPCMNMECRKDNCTDGHDLHDSVVADGQWLFREFVVYSPDQCYPEYLITYERE